MVHALISLLPDFHHDDFARARNPTILLQGRRYSHGVQQEGLNRDFGCQERSHDY